MAQLLSGGFDPQWEKNCFRMQQRRAAFAFLAQPFTFMKEYCSYSDHHTQFVKAQSSQSEEI